MSDSDRDARIERLAAAAAARRTDAETRTRRALMKLDNSGQAVSFVAVARLAGVSTSFLYQHDQLRRDIETRRTTRRPSMRPDTETASAASLRIKLQVALQRNRDLTEQVVVLRTENEALRSRLLELGHRHDRSATGA